MDWRESLQTGLYLLGQANQFLAEKRKKEAMDALAEAQRHLESVVGNARVEVEDRAAAEKALLMVYEKQGRNEFEATELLEKKRRLTARKCFIATAALGSSEARGVLILRAFRDEILHTSPLGRLLSSGYDRFSPPLAALIEKSPFLQAVARALLVSPAARLAEYALALMDKKKRR